MACPRRCRSPDLPPPAAPHPRGLRSGGGAGGGARQAGGRGPSRGAEGKRGELSSTCQRTAGKEVSPPPLQRALGVRAVSENLSERVPNFKGKNLVQNVHNH